MRDPIPGLPFRVGRYDLLLEIASGGMGKVYLARVQSFQGFERIVAVKCCYAELAEETELVEMFTEEARLAARIHHANAVATFDVGFESGVLYLAMDYVEGAALVTLIKGAVQAKTTIPLPQISRIVSDLLAGLHAAHETRDAAGVLLGVIHRDVSPQNVLVGSDGMSRLIDFGVARVNEHRAITKVGQLKGKMGYMAPEQLRQEPLTRASDVFGAGVVLWEALTLRRLFGNKDRLNSSTLKDGPAPPPSSVVPTLSAELDAVVLRALALDPSERYPTAHEFLVELERAVPPAPARDVAATLELLAPTVLAERRSALRRLSSEGGLATPTNRPATPATPEPGSGSLDVPITGVTATPHPRKRLYTIAAGAVGSAIVGGLLLGLLMADEPAPAQPAPIASSAPIARATPAPAMPAVTATATTAATPSPLAAASPTPTPAVSRKAEPRRKPRSAAPKESEPAGFDPESP